MLSIDIYHEKFLRFLCPHFRKEITPEISAAYYEAFEGLSDETFSKVCKMAFIECERMPAPKWFLDKAADLAEQERRSLPAIRALPDANDRNVVYISREQQIANIRRLRSMMKNLGQMPHAATNPARDY